MQQEWIDKNFLASTYVHTPDPRQENPKVGQRLLVSWDFPRSVFEKKLLLKAIVRFWDGSQQIIEQKIERRRGYEAFFFAKQGQSEDKKILTYLVQAISEQGEIVGFWEHQFWTPLIEVGAERVSQPRSNSSPVSSQERQESVIDTP